jgi:hypothetical protein
MKSEQIKEITNKATEQLVAALNSGHSQALTGYLKAIGRFHRYSLHNVLLIASQKPNASYVAGFRTWNELGRFVRKGEKGIMILAPIVPRKGDHGGEHDETSRRVTGFRAAYVFDVSQTDGQELPQIGTVEGDPCQYGVKLRSFALTQGIAVEYSTEIVPARGTSYGGRIALLRRSPMNSHTSFFTATTVGRRRANASAKPKRKLRRLLSARPLVLQPARRLRTTSSFGTATSRF